MSHPVSLPPPTSRRCTSRGGCLESVAETMQVGRWMMPGESYAGSVLLLEPSSGSPPPCCGVGLPWASPQVVLPYGGEVTVDGDQRLISADFG